MTSILKFDYRNEINIVLVKMIDDMLIHIFNIDRNNYALLTVNKAVYKKCNELYYKNMVLNYDKFSSYMINTIYGDLDVDTH